jgi:hypothetical protein
MNELLQPPLPKPAEAAKEGNKTWQRTRGRRLPVPEKNVSARLGADVNAPQRLLENFLTRAALGGRKDVQKK